MFRGAHVFALSVVSNSEWPWTIAHQRFGSSGSCIVCEMPRFPGGWFAWSFHLSRPGCPSSVLTSSNVFPPSVLPKMPHDSAPTNSRPWPALRLEILFSFRSESSP